MDKRKKKKIINNYNLAIKKCPGLQRIIMTRAEKKCRERIEALSCEKGGEMMYEKQPKTSSKTRKQFIPCIHRIGAEWVKYNSAVPAAKQEIYNVSSLPCLFLLL